MKMTKERLEGRKTRDGKADEVREKRTLEFFEGI
jgi:hypothetical protein